MKDKKQTKEAKISCVDDGFGICLSRQLVERGKTTAYVSDAKYSAVGCVNDFCLIIDLVLCFWHWRDGWAGGGRSWAR